MDCDVNIEKFVNAPFVIERPADADLFADTVVDDLMRAGMRLAFGPEKTVADQQTSLLATSLPPGIGLLSRDGKFFGMSDPVSTIVCGAARAYNYANAEQPALAMASAGWTMLGHAMTGADRATAGAFSTAMAIGFGATPQTLSWIAQANTYESASKAWNLTAKIPEYAAGVRDQIASVFKGAPPDAAAAAVLAAPLAERAMKHIATTSLATEQGYVDKIRSRIASGIDGRPTASAEGWRLSLQIGETFSGPSVATLDPNDVATVDGERIAPFEKQSYVKNRMGPSYLPADKFNEESRRITQFLHPDLLKVVARASEICDVDFQVVPDNGGLRTPGMQRKLKAKGASRATIGRHTFGYAIDIAPVDSKGRVNFDDLEGFAKIKDAMKQAAMELEVPIEWGGNWKRLVDQPHFELNRRVYPGPNEHRKPEDVFVAFR